MENRLCTSLAHQTRLMLQTQALCEIWVQCATASTNLTIWPMSLPGTSPGKSLMTVTSNLIKWLSTTANKWASRQDHQNAAQAMIVALGALKNKSTKWTRRQRRKLTTSDWPTFFSQIGRNQSQRCRNLHQKTCIVPINRFCKISSMAQRSSKQDRNRINYSKRHLAKAILKSRKSSSFRPNIRSILNL